MRTTLPVDAATAWTMLGLRWMETLAASTQVVAHRTSRVNTPAQWFAMGHEKVDAALEASSAMTRQMARFPVSNAFAAWHAWPNLLMAVLAPYHSRTTRTARRRRR
jgi:hypothetical protein